MVVSSGKDVVDADDLRAHLEAAGVYVHLVTMTPAGDFLVYLEANRAEHEQAKAAARLIPGVRAAVISPVTTAIMYVTLL